ncbi:MAG: hydroxymethylpyrimidine/phosphomethylpyrimidine kinase [Methylococcales bacterium]|jgi:hydroxymethylpyrimidine/phosphomethylpyrimidine kinase|nr:hydroxymethylpyrimidine/phosphomethylpyrimidine kinase [Methylococcales bacterium]
MSNCPPVVLSFSGHDPSGGAGIQADIETLSSHQCHSTSIITALTEQDTTNVYRIFPQQPATIIQQANRIFNDMPVKAIKIGLIGHADIAYSIAKIIIEHPEIPVVLDPILAAGGGTPVANQALIEAIIEALLPLTTVLTPNSEEARKLTSHHDLDNCGIQLLQSGCQYVLITGTHEQTPNVTHKLYHQDRCIETLSWDRLPHDYHGSGCTLATSIAALLAYQLTPVTAIIEAQQYCWDTLDNGYKIGQGQHLPNRLFWMQTDP